MASLLLQPLKIGDLQLRNRVIMSPLTRIRATGEDGRTPNDLMKEYYVQRARPRALLLPKRQVSVMPIRPVFGVKLTYSKVYVLPQPKLKLVQ